MSDFSSRNNEASSGVPLGNLNPENIQRGGAVAAHITGPMLQFNSSAAKSFLGSLFDFSFTYFITGKLIKFLYFIFIALAGVVTVSIIISAFGAGATLGSSGTGTLVGILALIVSPIIFLIVVTYARVALELVMVLFKIEEHLAVRR